MNCTHSWKTYEGFTDSFEYCSLCNIKKGAHLVEPITVELSPYKENPYLKAFKELYYYPVAYHHNSREMAGFYRAPGGLESLMVGVHGSQEYKTLMLADPVTTKAFEVGMRIEVTSVNRATGEITYRHTT